VVAGGAFSPRSVLAGFDIDGRLPVGEGRLDLPLDRVEVFRGAVADVDGDLGGEPGAVGHRCSRRSTSEGALPRLAVGGAAAGLKGRAFFYRRWL
jgi:hypothetical protein